MPETDFKVYQCYPFILLKSEVCLGPNTRLITIVPIVRCLQLSGAPVQILLTILAGITLFIYFFKQIEGL